MSKKKLKLLEPRNAAAISRVGEAREPDMSLVPHTSGESVRVSFRADALTVADFNEHLRRLEDMAPGFKITRSDVVRSLMQEGARSFREKFPRDDQPPTDDGDSDA